ncbi:zinc knuckle CX2CX4HX4C [Artemisia annua]|uniref:Zinc knuckle CX2CX4HX4C n=1 Tax=Artemisia annua TaxID=35608 RepID=A0A2U1MXE4_ARTAN|nr:zinc knuckle CX2CX4HX4C [Artemisia annua]
MILKVKQRKPPTQISEPDLPTLQDSSNGQPPRTYASIFKDAENNKNKGTLRFIASLVTDLGTRCAIIPDNLIDKEAEGWSRTLVGYFIGKRPAFQLVKFHATWLWKRFDLEDVILNDQGYTAEMCEKKTGRGAFARVLVQINSALEIPKFAEAEIRKIVRKLRLEYNWIPPRCLHCKIFGHVLIDCSARPRTEAELTKKVDAAPTAANEDGPSRADDQGFEQPKRRKRRAKTTLNSVIRDPTTSTSGLDTQQGAGKGSPPESNIESRNPYDILDGLNTEIGSSSSITHVEKVPEDSEDEVYEDDNPTVQFMKADK